MTSIKNENCQEIEPSIQAGGACRSSAKKHPSKTQLETKASSRIEEEEESDAKKLLTFFKKTPKNN